ncbi:J domain-containing protein [Kitasatospora sp. MAP5-34]|uniref:J domain-containing protein n=1 Tax=Kitasatospora sp. MAP5-34 TaxID=3035102 RepID=UPI0024731BF3|nr:J domain-containing protein [Kitasatospora sp. MAP5-34]MDH6580499.1 curved DNA-binding protein CbpA [Kitasatospora sp. MAP5-34]
MGRGPDRPDPYAVLGVTHSASARQITSAYRALARMLHPDTAPEEPRASARRLSEVAAAYEVLHDPARRAAYDAAQSARTSGTRRAVAVPVVHVGYQTQGRRDVPNPLGEWDRPGSLGSPLRVGPVRREDALPDRDGLASALLRWLSHADPRLL